MNNWLLTDASGKTRVFPAWSARHAVYLAKQAGFTPVSQRLLGRSNPTNPDAWVARPRASEAAGWTKRA